MSLIVQKFGGSSVANTNLLLNAAKKIIKKYNEGNEVIAVVSAQGNTTDKLIAEAFKISPLASNRELDVLLSSGEQVSIALLSIAIKKLGFPVISLLGWQAGFKTDSNFGNAQIKKVETERIKKEIEKKNIVIVAGFQGIDSYGDITTFGRGGSDTSAVAIAAAMKANICQIYTDVEGVYTADPHKIPDARKLSEISYDAMLEMASLGAQVLNSRSVEIAKKYKVKLEVLSSLTDVPGTIVREMAKNDEIVITGITGDKDVAIIEILEMPDKKGENLRIFSKLSDLGINTDVTQQFINDKTTKNPTFAVKRNILLETLNILKSCCVNKIFYDSKIAKVSLIGAGLKLHPEVAAAVFETLNKAKIKVHLSETSETKISVFIDNQYMDKAVKILHDKFF
ncbi:MAG: aspartate kinase [Oscillospiraceae bacterium]|jgi:aspartate kinase|nr:aspartate kinase [Oscillospiraceae bacterium]